MQPEPAPSLNKRLKEPLSGSFFRYGIMAVIVVGIEVGSFWLLNSPFGIHYLTATIISLLIGIVLNWLGSRHFVFSGSKHGIEREFALVLVVSLVGLVLQSLIVTVSVEILAAAPLIGKSAAIVITFFWNYIIRKRYIYLAP